MVEPVKIADFFAIFFFAATVIVSGAPYPPITASKVLRV